VHAKLADALAANNLPAIEELVNTLYANKAESDLLHIMENYVRAMKVSTL
jgi:hypothetical protein